MAIAIDSSQGSGISVSSSSYVDGNTIYLDPRLTVCETEAASYDNVVAKVTGVSGLTPIFSIPRAGVGSRWWWYSGVTVDFSYDNYTWYQFGNPVSVGESAVTVQHTAPFAQDTVWFARNRRQGTAQIRHWIDYTLDPNYGPLLEQLSGGSNYVVDTYSTQQDELTREVAATDLFGFVIRGGGVNKQNMVLVSGVHAGEDWGTTVYCKAIEYLCGQSVAAIALRSAFDFICLPLLNAPGRDGGHCRAQFQVTAGTHNELNRHFKDEVNLFETVSKPRAAILTALENTDGIAAAIIDFHVGMWASIAQYWYNNGGSLHNDWVSTAATRFADCGGTALVGANYPADSVTDWGVSVVQAPLCELTETNAGPVLKTDARAIALGQAIVLTIYDLYQAGKFPGAGVPTPGTVSGSLFARRAA